MNDDCFRKIFQYLSINQRIEIERVSKRWQMVSRSSWNDFTRLHADGILNRVDKKFNKKSIQQIILNVIQRGGLFLKKIDVSSFCCTAKYDVSSILKYISEYCFNIEHFYLSLDTEEKFDFSENMLINIFSKNQNLKDVKFGEVTLSGQCLLSLNGKSLVMIHLYSVKFYKNSSYLSEAFSKFKNLKDYTYFGDFKNLEIILKEIISDDNKISCLRIGNDNDNDKDK